MGKHKPIPPTTIEVQQAIIAELKGYAGIRGESDYLEKIIDRLKSAC
jgi:hypothetical protein